MFGAIDHVDGLIGIFQHAFVCDIDCDAANRVDRFHHAVKINRNVILDIQVKIFIQGFNGQGRTAVAISGVDFFIGNIVFVAGRNARHEIAHDRRYRDFPGFVINGQNHDGIGAIALEQRDRKSVV